jgi:formamidase
MDPIRYAAAACQTDLSCPVDRQQMSVNTSRMTAMIDAAVAGARPFLPVRLIVFPEFAHAAPIYPSVDELLHKLAVPVPNEHTERLRRKAREHDVYIQSGSMLEADPRWPAVVFNTTVLIGPEGILFKYRKVNPWIPYEVHASPHDLPGYDEPLFPVADTPIGRLGCAICYDWLFPEAIRQLADNGAEVLIRVSAYMDPWGSTEPMNWWSLVNRCRALRTRRLSWPPIRVPVSRTTHHTRGRAEARLWTSTAGSWLMRRPAPASGSSLHRSMSPRFGTNVRSVVPITCDRI